MTKVADSSDDGHEAANRPAYPAAVRLLSPDSASAYPSARSSRRRPQPWSLPHDIDVDTVAHQIPSLSTKLLINNGPSDGMPIASFVSSDDRLN